MREISSSAIVIDETDNVGLAIKDLKAGENVTLKTKERERVVTLKDDIKFLHKFAITDIRIGDKITKYGQVIGVATSDIYTGQHVHTHNISSLRGKFGKRKTMRKPEQAGANGE